MTTLTEAVEASDKLHELLYANYDGLPKAVQLDAILSARAQHDIVRRYLGELMDMHRIVQSVRQSSDEPVIELPSQVADATAVGAAVLSVGQHESLSAQLGTTAAHLRILLVELDTDGTYLPQTALASLIAAAAAGVDLDEWRHRD